jgi:aminoglycoside 3-N-acetyltransferase
LRGRDLLAGRKDLAGDLVRLGIREGDLLMVHAGVRSVGRIVGGVNALIQAMFDAIGSDGTIAAYVDFEPWYEDTDDPLDIPVFDKRIAQAARDHGVLHETLRTWPGALRSDHPDAGVVAIGRLAESIVATHPSQYGYGEGTPFERIVEAHGRVLMIGAPLDTITLLHYAEHKADLPAKRTQFYERLMPGPDGPNWVRFEEFDTRNPVSEILPDDCFKRIATDYLANGRGLSGTVGLAESYLFDAPDLVDFAIRWLEGFPKNGTPDRR